MNVLRTNLEAILGRIGKETVAEAKTYDASMYSTTDLASIFGGPGLRTPMAHRVEWWPFGTVLRRARLDSYHKAMYIGGGRAIALDSHHDVIVVHPDHWVSVPETAP